MSIIKPISPYVYKGVHRTSKKFYFGVRYRNETLKLVPYDDLGIKYFTSSKFVKSNFHEFEWEILAQFCDKKDALAFEDTLIKEHWGNPLLINRNRGGKDFHRPDDYKVTPISKSKVVKNRSQTVKKNWEDPSFRNKMIESRNKTHTTEEFKRSHSIAMKKVTKLSKSIRRVCRLSDKKEMTVQNFFKYLKTNSI